MEFLLRLGDNQAMELINSTERLTTAFVGGIEISGAVMLGQNSYQ